jgi:hypothetical protein
LPRWHASERDVVAENGKRLRGIEFRWRRMALTMGL